MAWAESQRKENLWKELISVSVRSPQEIFNHDPFMEAFNRREQQILEWFDSNFRSLLGSFVELCLVLPKEIDSKDRKFKEPTQAISFLVNLIDPNPIGENANRISPPSFPVHASYGRIKSEELVKFVIDKMFVLFSENNPSLLVNTLIPGYFLRIFKAINNTYSSLLTQALKETHKDKFEKLLTNFGNLNEIFEIMVTILIVPIERTSINMNLQMSTVYSTSSSFSGETQRPQNGNQGEANHPFLIKYGLILLVLDRMRNYKRINDVIAMENLFGLVCEVAKMAPCIYEGSAMAELICREENIKTLCYLALGNDNKLFGPECQLKSLETLKYCMKIMTPIDRSNFLPKIEQFVQFIMQTDKPTMILTSILELITSWYLTETNTSMNNNTSMNMGKSMDSLNLSGSVDQLNNGDLMEVERVLTEHLLFRKLLDICVVGASCNIFHEEVVRLFEAIFKSKNHVIINSIFHNNRIIQCTLEKTINFKSNIFFGHFFHLIKIYTSGRIKSDIIEKCIKDSEEMWMKQYNEVLGPHFERTEVIRLGEMNIQEPIPIEFTTHKVERNKAIGENMKIASSVSMAGKSENIESDDLITRMEKKLTNDFDTKEKQEPEEEMKPISIDFNKNTKEVDEEKPKDRQEFEIYLKNAMAETNNLVEERKKSKSRTPKKMINGETKRNRWGGDENVNSPPKSRKAVSNNEKVTLSARTDVENSENKIRLIRISKSTLPKKERYRKINENTEANLNLFIERWKKYEKNMR